MSLSWLKERVCVTCQKRYQPTGTTQRYCEPCGVVNEKQQEKKYSLSDKALAYRRRYNRSDIGRKKYARYRAKPEYKEYSRLRYHSEKESVRKAHYYVSNAVRDGRLFRSEYCEQCGVFDWGEKRSMIEAHHYKGYDPDHWLDVQWLCVTCHKLADAGKEVDASYADL